MLSAEIHASWKSYHDHISETKAFLADWAFHHHLAKILMMEVPTEQLIKVVDVKFMPHNNLEIS